MIIYVYFHKHVYWSSDMKILNNKKIDEIKIEYEILKALFPDKELTSGDLLDEVSQTIYGKDKVQINNEKDNVQTNDNKKLSRRTFSKYLNILHKKKEISYRTNPNNKRERLYGIRKATFPDVFAALSFKAIFNLWLKMFSENHEYKNGEEEIEKILELAIDKDGKINEKKIDQIAIKEVIDKQNELRQRICNESIKELEMMIGKSVLNFMVFQTEKDIQALEVLNNFNQFLYIFLKKSEYIKDSIRKSDYYNEFEKAMQVPYSDVEKELLELIYREGILRQIMNWPEITAEIPYKIDFSDDFHDNFYNELGFPFNTLWNEIKKKRYLFSWDMIPGKDNETLKEILKRDYGINWVEKANIEKINDNKTIKVSNNEKSLLLKLKNKNTRVILEIDDNRTDKFIVKKVDDKLNIYTKLLP